MGRELKRVPLDFDCPIGSDWQGYVNPHYTAQKCTACGGSGYSPRAKYLHDLWYGYVPFDPASNGSEPFSSTDEIVQAKAKRNYQDSVRRAALEARRLADLFNESWSHHLSQDDVDALVEAGRLCDFTHTWKSGDGWKLKDPPYHPTAKEVNEWSIRGFGHDSINCHVCIEARCKREGADTACTICHGHGDIWPSEEDKRRYETWEQIEPPTGDGYQIWQTVSNGGPCSPVFAAPEELARWMVANDDSVTRDTTYDQWLKFINGPGWAPSLVATGGELSSGVAAVA